MFSSFLYVVLEPNKKKQEVTNKKDIAFNLQRIDGSNSAVQSLSC